jgi:hypothetical protein
MKVAFYKSKEKLFNRFVAWWDDGPYSHCEVVLEEDGENKTFASSSYLDGGVRTKTWIPNPDSWDYLEVDCDLEYAKQWFKDNDGKNYDVLGLLGFILRRGTQDQSKFFCSEAVAAALKMDEAWRYDPNILYLRLKEARR